MLAAAAALASRADRARVTAPRPRIAPVLAASDLALAAALELVLGHVPAAEAIGGHARG